MRAASQVLARRIVEVILRDVDQPFNTQRKLKATWSLESANDLRRQMGIPDNSFDNGTFVCKLGDIAVYGQVTATELFGMIRFVEPMSGAEHREWADDLRKLNLLELIALEAA